MFRRCGVKLVNDTQTHRASEFTHGVAPNVYWLQVGTMLQLDNPLFMLHRIERLNAKEKEREREQPRNRFSLEIVTIYLLFMVFARSRLPRSEE